MRNLEPRPDPDLLEGFNCSSNVNIGFVGAHNAGKSAAVTAMFMLEGDDAPLVAFEQAQGVKEDIKPRCPFPDNERIVVWDIAGWGSREFPIGDYRERFGFGCFDVLVFVIPKGASEDCEDLVQFVREKSVPHMILKTRLDEKMNKPCRESWVLYRAYAREVLWKLMYPAHTSRIA